METIVCGAVQKQIFEGLSGREWHSTQDLSQIVGCSKAHAHQTLKRYQEEVDGLECREGAGYQGANLYRLTSENGGLEILTEREKELQKPCTFVTVEGYVRARSYLDGEWDEIPIHRLVAIAEYGTGAVAGRHVHHKNGIPWDNRPSNLDVRTSKEHLRSHWHGEPLEDRLSEASDREVIDALEKSGYAQLAAELAKES